MKAYSIIYDSNSGIKTSRIAYTIFKKVHNVTRNKLINEWKSLTRVTNE